MAIVKANYVKRGKGEKERTKATIRYITHRRDRDGHTVTRELFGYDGALTKEQTYRMIDEARRGTIFYRIVLILQRGLSGLRLPSTLAINLKRTLSMGTIGRIVSHLMIPDDFKSPLQIEPLLSQGDGQQRPRLGHA
jgi:hypothetical protein